MILIYRVMHRRYYQACRQLSIRCGERRNKRGTCNDYSPDANIKRLFEDLIRQLSPTYIFLDILNEFEGAVQDIFKLLIGVVSNYDFRLGCSTQYTPEVKKALEDYQKLVVTAADTQEDNESYLSTKIPKHIIGFISEFQSIVLGDTEGCFLWASNMIESLYTLFSVPVNLHLGPTGCMYIKSLFLFKLPYLPPRLQIP